MHLIVHSFVFSNYFTLVRIVVRYRVNFRIVNLPTSMFLGGGRKLENLEEVHKDTGRIYETPHREEPELRIELGTLEL